MNKRFNTTGDCKSNLHYMVDIKERLIAIKELVDNSEYFTINRARQYGKTTTLKLLENFIKEEYIIISLDFQIQMSMAKFQSELDFSKAFATAFLNKFKEIKCTPEIEQALQALTFDMQQKNEHFDLVELFLGISHICSACNKPVVLMIDEVDSSTNNQIFLEFLSKLRGYYLDRDRTPTFQSVILVGVYDIKNIKMKLHAEQETKTNSPWNIAADFDIEMSFSANDISTMLSDYELDYQTGMNLNEMSHLIYDYTSGYPFLVSRICKLIDEKVAKSASFPSKKNAWTKAGFLQAIKLLLDEKNTLFESLIHKLYDFKEIYNLVYMLLFSGKSIPYNARNNAIQIAEMFGLIKKYHGTAIISNRIFETLLYDQFLVDEIVENSTYTAALQNKNQFIENGHLNMELVIDKFIQHFHDIYGDERDSFIEDIGRKYFLLYLKPIINGVGNYYIEAQTRDMKRTDIIIDYCGEQFIIEMKIWHGNEYNTRGEQQLSEYLEYYHLKKGYMLSFNFNKNKQVGIHHVRIGNKILVEGVV